MTDYTESNEVLSGLYTTEAVGSMSASECCDVTGDYARSACVEALLIQELRSITSSEQWTTQTAFTTWPTYSSCAPVATAERQSEELNR